MSDLRVIHGGGAIIELLETLLERARAGDLEAMAVATVLTDGRIGGGVAYVPEAPALWIRTLGAVANLQGMIHSGELRFDV